MDVDFSPAVEQLQNLIEGFIAAIPNIIVALVVFILFAAIGAATRSIVRKLALRRGRQSNLGLVLGRLSQWAIVILGVLVSFAIIFPRFNAAELLQLLGIGSVAISFAFRDIIENFLAGILLLLNEPFRVGDQIRVQDAEGTVEEINTRATTIITYDGRRVVVPNLDIFTGFVTVNTAFEQRRIDVDVGIGYGDDITAAKDVILRVLREIGDVLDQPPPTVIVTDLGASSVNLRLRWWIRPPRRADANDSRDQVLSQVKEALTAAGIDLPFTTYQVLFHDQTEETDGDRRYQREGWPAGNDSIPQPRPIGRLFPQPRER